MKAGLLTLTGLSAVAVAQPHFRHHHQKRDIEVVTVTDVAYAAAPNVYVFVDAEGNPTSTSTEAQGAAPTTSSSIVNAHGKAWGGNPYRPAHASSSATSTSVDVAPVATSSTSEYVAPTTSEYVAPTTSEYVAPTTSEYVAPTTSEYVAPTTFSSEYVAPTTSEYVAPTTHEAIVSSTPVASVYPTTSSAAPATSSAASSGCNGLGIAYSPYKGAGGCKSQDQINTDLAKLSEYCAIRLYGTDCDQVAMVMKAAPNAKIFAGIYDIDDISGAVSILSAAASNGWDRFDTISIGNELVNNGQSSPAAMKLKVAAAKTALTAVGYTGPVVTVDTFIAIINNKDSMCDIGDYVAANAHPFFDGNVAASGAGDWVQEQVQRLQTSCPGKKIVITETGWPWKGESNNKAIPGTSEQTDATNSLKSAFSSNMYLFTAFNDMWKTNSAATFDAEQYWGMHGYSSSDAGSY